MRMNDEIMADLVCSLLFPSFLLFFSVDFDVSVFVSFAASAGGAARSLIDAGLAVGSVHPAWF